MASLLKMATKINENATMLLKIALELQYWRLFLQFDACSNYSKYQQCKKTMLEIKEI